jgi:hypothetical protein
MSWSDYITGFMARCQTKDDEYVLNPCYASAIIGSDGTVWASTENFKLEAALKCKADTEEGLTIDVTVNEWANLSDCVKNQGVTKKVGGVHINGEKYVAINNTTYGEHANEFVQYFKKYPDGGASVGMTKLGNFIIGLWCSKNTITHQGGEKEKTENQNAYYCNLAAEKLSKCLSDYGY